MLRSMVQRVRRLLRFKEVKLGENNGGVFMPELQQEHSSRFGCSSLKSSGPRCPNQEIQVVEPKGYSVTHVDEIQLEDESIVEESCYKGRLGYPEIGLKEVVMEKEESICEVAELKRKSRRAKLKSKMKKIVPKKLRNSRKQHDPQRVELVKEDAVSLCDEQEEADQFKDERESEIASGFSSISSGRYEEENSTSSISAFDGSTEVNDEESQRSKEKGKEIEAAPTWRYLVLCLIVLIGLIGGRGFALALTLSWCLLLKLGEKLPTYVHKDAYNQVF